MRVVTVIDCRNPTDRKTKHLGSEQHGSFRKSGTLKARVHDISRAPGEHPKTPTVFQASLNKPFRSLRKNLLSVG